MKPVSVKVHENVVLSTLKQFSRFLPHSPLLLHETQAFLDGAQYTQKQVSKSQGVSGLCNSSNSPHILDERDSKG